MAARQEATPMQAALTRLLQRSRNIAAASLMRREDVVAELDAIGR
ncbi:MAG: hypothetical protein PGN21_08165 [Sphingomonas paucimobilis]